MATTHITSTQSHAQIKRIQLICCYKYQISISTELYRFYVANYQRSLDSPGKCHDRSTHQPTKRHIHSWVSHFLQESFITGPEENDKPWSKENFAVWVVKSLNFNFTAPVSRLVEKPPHSSLLAKTKASIAQFYLKYSSCFALDICLKWFVFIWSSYLPSFTCLLFLIGTWWYRDFPGKTW